MTSGTESAPIRWRVHLRSSPSRVFEYLTTPDGRSRFWAESAEQAGNKIEFVFSNGQRLRSEVLENTAPKRFRLSYFGGSRVTFDLQPTQDDGTDLLLTEDGVPEAEREANRAGWVSVLLTLKAAVDFGVDLRNADVNRTWEDGYVDV